jgi:pSer/pThr/pTyr-binding forkhead associated (FHA) protein
MIVAMIVTKGRDAGRVIRLEEGEARTLGRGSQADITLSDPVVSRLHCRIRIEDGACYVRDMGSRNGTSINGQRILGEARLADDDVLGLGTEIAEVRITPDMRPDEDAAEPAPASTPAVPLEVEERPPARPPARLSGPELTSEGPEVETVRAGRELERQGEEERLLGTVVGGCRIEGLLGRDDISSIYRATQISMERPVALKILSPAMNGDRRSRERFIGAARSGGKLNHPNIVRVYDAGEEKGMTFVAMEFVAGKSVRQLLGERTQPLPMARAVEIGEQIAGALDYAHSVALIHGHVTADTILVTPLNVAKLGEPGFVRAAEESGPLAPNPARRADELQFTPPEQLAAPHSPTPQGDIYSLAVVLFLMVAGQMPFRAAGEKELREKIRRGAHEPLRRLRRDAPDRLVRAIEGGMAVQVAQRFSRAADLLAALEQSRKGLS